jgi:hypothetical protein
MTPKAKEENRLGPVNPFTVGNVFIEAAKKLEWIEEDKTERHRQYFITPKGLEEMTKLGMNIERALLYREPPAENQRRQMPPEHQHRQPQAEHQRRAPSHNQRRSRDRHRH